MPEADFDDRFVERLTQNQIRLCSFIYALVLDWGDAEEILQETNVQLWEKRNDYDPERPFLPWARSIARFQVLAQRSRRRRERMQFRPELVELLAREADASEQQQLAEQEALDDCLAKLDDRARQLVELCYQGGMKIKEAAALLRRSVEGTYKALARIRAWLHACVQTRLAEEG